MNRLLLFLLLTMPAAMFAQNAQLTGLVKDPSGAAISDATVTLTNTLTGAVASNKSTTRGSYEFASVAPGTYLLRAEHEGFTATDMTGIVLHVADNKELDVTMKVGSTAQTVTVDGSGLTINTTDASVGTVIDRQFVENIPMNGRSFQTLVLLSPGVVTNSPQGIDSGEFSVNGMRTDSNSNTVDGASASNTAAPGASYPGITGGLPNETALGTTQATLMLDAMEEFRINTSTYSAEYGNHPGAQISYRSRSGTNAYHGSLYDYLRNSAFDANNWFNTYSTTPVPTPAERQNDFGGTLGGPILIPRLYSGKDRLFFFFAYEGLRLAQPQASQIYYVPSNGTYNTATYSNPEYKNLRQYAPASLQPFLNAWPLPNCSTVQDPQCIDYGEGGSPYRSSPPSSGVIDAVSARADYQLLPNMRVFVRYADTTSDSAALGTLGPYTSVISDRTRIFLLGLDNAFSGTIFNELRLQYSPASYLLTSNPALVGGAAPYNFYEAQGLPVGGETYARLYLAPSTSSIYQQSYGSRQNQSNITDSLTWSHGKHVFKFGANYMQTTGYYDTPGKFNRSPTMGYYFTTASQILTNLLDEAAVIKFLQNDPTTRIMGFYGQDQWRLNPRLSLSLGLRWDIDPPPSVSGAPMYGYTGDINNPSTLGLSQPQAPLYKTDYTDFGPRVGVAATLRDLPGHQLILRAGGGIFYDTISIDDTFGNGDGVGNEKTVYYYNLPYPLTPNLINITVPMPPTPPYSFLYYPANNVVPAHSFQYNITLEQALGDKQSISMGYVASMGRKLSTLKSYSVGTLNPLFGSFELFSNGPGSSYNSLQVKYQRQMAHGLQALASYTWAHSIDWASTDGYSDVYPLKRGNSDHDIRDNFTAAAVYSLPTTYSSRLERTILGYWNADLWVIARTAFPYELEGPSVTDPITGDVIYGELDWNGKNPYVHEPGIPGGRQLDPAAFSVTTSPLGAGSAPRNFLRGFGEAQANMALQRSFPLYERSQLEFRAEAFNIFNHPNFGTINNSCGTTTAGAICTNVLMGQATNTLSTGLGGLSSLYQQGGPRSLQFMLKIEF